MRTLIVTHYFPPEIGAPQERLSEFARFWAEAGDDVTVLTGMPNHPTGIVHEGYRNRIRVEERMSDYQVVRTWIYATPNEGVAKKTPGHISFMLSSVLLGLRKSGTADVVLVSSPTFVSIFSAWCLAKVKGSKFVLASTRPLACDLSRAWSAPTNSRLIWLLERLELAAYAAADHIIVVSDGFRDNLITRGVPAGRITTIRNGADLEHSLFHRPSMSQRPGPALVLGLTKPWSFMLEPTAYPMVNRRSRCSL